LVEVETGVTKVSSADTDGGLNRKGDVAVVDDTFMRSWASLWAVSVSSWVGMETLKEWMDVS
jgi:hypothetical protein